MSFHPSQNTVPYNISFSKTNIKFMCTVLSTSCFSRLAGGTPQEPLVQKVYYPQNWAGPSNNKISGKYMFK